MNYLLVVQVFVRTPLYEGCANPKLTRVYHATAEFFGRSKPKVITMEMMGRVRRMKLRDGMSNSEIAKRTGLSRNTVKKWLKAAGEEVPKYRRSSGKATKLSAYEDTVITALKADAHRPKEHRRTARALFA